MSRVCDVLGVSMKPEVSSGGSWTEVSLTGEHENVIQALATMHDTEAIPLRVLVDAEVCEKNEFKDQVQTGEDLFGVPVRVLAEATFRPDPNSNSTNTNTKKVLAISGPSGTALAAIRAFASFVFHDAPLPSVGQQNSNTTRSLHEAPAVTGDTHTQHAQPDERTPSATALPPHPTYPLQTNDDAPPDYDAFPNENPTPAVQAAPAQGNLNTFQHPHPAAAPAQGFITGPQQTIPTPGFANGNKPIPSEPVYERLVWIAAHYVPRLIGGGGKCILEFQNRSGAQLEYDRVTTDEGLKSVKITGNSRQVDAAVSLITNKVASWAARDSGGPESETLWVPDVVVNQVIGKKGSKVSEFQLYSGASVFIDARSSTTMGTIWQVCSSLSVQGAEMQALAHHVYTIQGMSSPNGFPPCPQMQTLCRRLVVAGTQEAVTKCKRLVVDCVCRILRLAAFHTQGGASNQHNQRGSPGSGALEIPFGGSGQGGQGSGNTNHYAPHHSNNRSSYPSAREQHNNSASVTHHLPDRVLLPNGRFSERTSQTNSRTNEIGAAPPSYWAGGLGSSSASSSSSTANQNQRWSQPQQQQQQGQTGSLWGGAHRYTPGASAFGRSQGVFP
uniref:K Homology domain-containing protein n=1 Tax=Chromera velia CCMP2878 TaxID=1169474 RepID=A0A0G4HK79_9ALVE|eukprot:Cvel_1122.t1-p1 / transcript=Cvel_1122.t1 / gene=Cvel_1122 / organism=Chromera_velia_CCMP2878 / gene_product=hypothetical protein / transcript_product=hypothetical protein / location=Cvel_scaffold36:171533-174432(-) / protein_length=612 / sequence_SO=supercontig / SO=protein_coding / is_pseudo=false